VFMLTYYVLNMRECDDHFSRYQWT